MVAFFLYTFTAIATAIPVVWALGWAVWGAGTSPTEYLSLLGSLFLVIAAFVSFSNRRLAARFALVGTVAIWSFYFTAIAALAIVRLSDQELSLTVLRWSPSASPLTIQELTQVPNFPDMKLSQSDIQQIKDTGITGALSTYSVNGRYGNGTKSHVILIMQEPVTKLAELPEPDADSIIYVQYGHEWKKFPSRARTLKRPIRIEPMSGDPKQSSVMVELATSARQGFGVWWPNLENTPR